jgi:hypothetical protein
LFLGRNSVLEPFRLKIEKPQGFSLLRRYNPYPFRALHARPGKLPVLGSGMTSR